MANSLYIDVSKFNEAIKKIDNKKKELLQQLDDKLRSNAEDIATKAKQNVSRAYPEGAVDFGGLKNSISAKRGKPFEWHIVANVFYASFIEFGTGKFAAEYVASLPDNWQEFAASFKVSGNGGNFHDLVLRIKEWIKHKQIDVFAEREQQFDEESGNLIINKPRRRTKDEREQKLNEVAYLIARKLVVFGQKPKPFLFPAFQSQKQQIIKDIESILKQL